MNGAWIQTASNKIFEKSANKKSFVDAVREWTFQGTMDNGKCFAKCGLCSHENIRYEFLLENEITGEKMSVGSKCIKNFIVTFTPDLKDRNGNEVGTEKVDALTKEFNEKTVQEALERFIDNSSNNFLIAIATQMLEKKRLSPKQVKSLKQIYETFDDLEKKACEQVISINLARAGYQEDYKNFPKKDRDFVHLFFSSQQKKKYNVSS